MLATLSRSSSREGAVPESDYQDVAGLSPGQVDGLAAARLTTTGEFHVEPS